MADAQFSPASAAEGTLPPWEVAKAFAFDQVIRKMAEFMESPASKLLGEHVDEFIAAQVTLKGGGHPTARAVRKVISKCHDSDWYPGKVQGHSTGRPPVYSHHVKSEVARVAMDLKRKSSAPTPRKVRARLPQLTRNPDTGRPMDKKTVHGIFTTMCYDVSEDDPWQFLESPAQDMLPAEMLPRRVACAKHYLRWFGPGAWYHQVAIDPCYSLLPVSLARLQELQTKAMGKKRWMSKKASRQGNNLRAPATARTQRDAGVTRVDWTPVFARGKLRIFVVDPRQAAQDPFYPRKLNDATNLGKFVQHVLPGILEEMKEAHAWPNLPRTVVHDKASYMVTATHDRLQLAFAAALEAGGFASWTEAGAGGTKWLAPKWGDVYLHETAISHIRRLLDDEFACRYLGETVPHFAQRIQAVAAHMNSDAFCAPGGRGLAGLATEMRDRCEMVAHLKGQRIPK